MHESEVELNLDLMLDISWRKHIKFHAQDENELNLDYFFARYEINLRISYLARFSVSLTTRTRFPARQR